VTNGLVLYVLAIAAQRFGVLVHAFCVLSNHLHLVVTDPDARLPAFEQYLDSVVARALNACHGRWESFWAPSSYSAVALCSPQDIVDKTAYVLANPVAAGLVKTGREWPGLWSAPELFGAKPLSIQRPTTFFRESGYMPRTGELTLSAPPGFASAEEFAARVRNALEVLEKKARHEVESSGRGFLGAARISAQKPWGRPAPGEPRRQLNPRVASRDKWKRIEVLTQIQDFLDAYRVAWAKLRAKVPDVIFPAGTYKLRVQQGVPCAAT
jgi:REP element-mobilizing transposase RayT